MPTSSRVVMTEISFSFIVGIVRRPRRHANHGPGILGHDTRGRQERPTHRGELVPEGVVRRSRPRAD